MHSERDGQKTAHLVAFPDGRKVRVVPDGRNSGQRRSRVTSEALAAICEQVGGEDHASELARDGINPIMDPVAYLIGCLAVAGLTWQIIGGELTPGEWWEDWLEANPTYRDCVIGFVRDMGDAGFEVVRKDGD
jgi:hypothetical protein